MSALDPAALLSQLVRAQQLMRDGSLDAAGATLSQVLAQSPDDAAALYLSGILAHRRGDFGAAIELQRKAVVATPQSAPAWLALGNAYAACNDRAQAADAYRQMLAREPRSFEGHYNLGLVLKAQGDIRAAARAFHAAWVYAPHERDAGKQCVDTIGDWVRAGDEMPVVERSSPVPSSTSFTIVVCSIDDAKLQRVTALYHRLFAGTDHELLTIRNADSLAEAYNGAVRRSRNALVILSHDDIEVLAPDFADRIARHLERFDALGVAGAVHVSGPAPLWSGHPHLRGWVTHHRPAESVWRAGVLAPAPVADKAVVLDGVLLAGRREAFAEIAFDPDTFDGFHLYDVDWSYRAGMAGLRLGVAGDLLVVHESRGAYDGEWERYARQFCVKHGFEETPPPTEGPFYEAVFDHPDQVRAFYRRLTELADDLLLS